MAVSYSWKVTQLTKKTQDGVADVISHCRWELTGTESTTGTTGVFMGATPLEYNSGSFIVYDDLVEENVISWLENIVVNDYWDHVTERIQEQIDNIDDPNDEVSEESLPWASVDSSDAPDPIESGSV